MKEKIIEYFYQGKDTVETYFAGLEIFKASNSEPLFYNKIYKNLKILNQKLYYKELDYNVWNKGYNGIFLGLRRVIQRIIQTSLFDNFIMLTVKRIIISGADEHDFDDVAGLRGRQ